VEDQCSPGRRCILAQCFRSYGPPSNRLDLAEIIVCPGFPITTGGNGDNVGVGNGVRLRGRVGEDGGVDGWQRPENPFRLPRNQPLEGEPLCFGGEPVILEGEPPLEGVGAVEAPGTTSSSCSTTGCWIAVAA